MSAKPKDDCQKELPDIIIDPKTRKKYLKGKFLGKGGFAKCYELTDMETKEVYAGKFVSKTLLSKPHQREKMTQEISIHRSLEHKNIVKFYCFFEDDDNVYILLELCRRRSLMEMHKRRRQLTEPEVRYFMHQITLACKYLHENRVIHRDLKLGNLFLNDEMEIKLGDFGLATRLDYDGERKKTLCGTPNYIAPEVLNKKGHSYEVDVWSLGCMLFTMLVGKPPFETTSLKDTYIRIKKNEYHIPSRINYSARNLIQRLLQLDPCKRPNMEKIMQDEFMTTGYLPTRLPTSCLTMAPRFDCRSELSIALSQRKPLVELNTKGLNVVPEGNSFNNEPGMNANEMDQPNDFYLSDLLTQLTSVLASKPTEKKNINEDEAEDPAAVPMLWISKWVDYSDKYGLGYQLYDNSVGVVFNDATKLILLADGTNIQYIKKDGSEHFHTLEKYPDSYSKKITLLKYFRNYMNEHLLKAGAAMKPREGDEISRLPYMRSWFRTRSAIVMHLTNGTLQVNFFEDHTKIILCPLMNAVTYIDEKRGFRTFKLKTIEQVGCNKELATRLKYAHTMVERMSAKSRAKDCQNLKA